MPVILLALASPAAFSQTTSKATPPPVATGKATPGPAVKTAALPARPAPPVADWPTKPIRLLIGFPPGSVQDLSARAIAEPLSKALG
ncbi:MAG: tripartite tricarboxylate transporter substrate binding protein, partial [Rubrivivax sp.]|nr:tripartite tricarboxylate transporter substrate binding protein [Rubrivivax sp.]